MTVEIKVDNEVYLVPRTMGCASVCWKEPKVTVVSTAERPIIAVRLPDGNVIRTHESNIVARRPKPSAPRRTPAKPRPTLTNAEEVPLF